MLTVAGEGSSGSWLGTPLIKAAQSRAIPAWKAAASPRTGFVWSQSELPPVKRVKWPSVLVCWCFQRLWAGKDPLYSQFYLIILSESRAAGGSSRGSRKFGKWWCQPCLCVCVLGLSQPDHPGWGTRAETRDFCREDVQSRIQTLHRGAGGEGSFPVKNPSLLLPQSYRLPVTAQLYQRKSDPKHTLSSSSSGIAAWTQKSYYLPQTFPGSPTECRKLPSYFSWDWIKLCSPQTFKSIDGEFPDANIWKLQE